MNKPKNKILNLFLILLVCLAFIPAPVKADYIGVGLKWMTEGNRAMDGQEVCIQYGIYNPFDVDVEAYLVAEGEIKKYVTRTDPEKIIVPAGTSSGKAVQASICFNPPLLRFPPLLPISYKGTVSASFKGSGVSGTGSAVGASIQAPLTLMTGDVGAFITFIIAIVLILIALVLFLQRRKIIGGYRTIKLGREKAGKIAAVERLKEIEEEEKKLKQRLGGKGNNKIEKKKAGKKRKK